MEIFTKDYLEEKSGVQVFKKGKDIYSSGEVKDVKFSENTVYGRVQGSFLYKTQITIYSEENCSFNCSCPFSYNYGGLCKHEIALGLYVIDHPEIFKTDAKDEIRNLVETVDIKLLQEFITDSFFNNPKLLKKFKILIKEKESERKKAEKKKIKDEEDKIKKEKNIKNAKEKISTVKFNKISEKVKLKTESLDFNDYEKLIKKHFGVNSDFYNTEVLLDSANSEIEKQINNFLKPIKTYITINDLINAFAYLLEVYHGLIVADTSNIDKENEIYSDDIHYIFLDIFNTLISDFINYFKSNLNSENIKEVIDTLFNKLDVLYKYYETDKLNDDWIDLPVINKILPVLVINNKESVLYLKEKLDNCPFKTIKNDNIYENIYEKSDDIENWFNFVKDKYQNNELIAFKILKYFEQINDKQRFLSCAKELKFNIKGKLLDYLSNYLTTDDDFEFYKKIIFKHCLETTSIEVFKKINKIYDKANLFEFINIVYNHADNYTNYYLFYVKILKESELFDMIFDFMKKNPNHIYFDEAMTLVLNLYPEKCYLMISEMCEKHLLKHISINVYIKEAERIKLLYAVQNDEIKQKAKNLALYLYNLYPTRKSLKEAFQKVGIV